MIVVMIRHGLTEANLRYLFYGMADVLLHDSGKEEILKLKEEGIYPKVDFCYVTGLTRTRETAELIYGKEMPVDRVEGFNELNFGKYEMKHYDEVKDDPEFQAFLEEKSEDVVLPGGESRNMFRKRNIEAFQNLCLKELKEGKHQKIAIICHNGTICGVMEYYFGGQFFDWSVKNGRGIQLEVLSEDGKTLKIKDLGKI